MISHFSLKRWLGRPLMAAALPLCLVAASPAAWGYSQACQLVAQMAGPDYQAKPERFGSLTPPEDIPATVAARFIERTGSWFIYQADRDWFAKDACAPIQERIDGRVYEFVPVLLNQRSGANAVVNGTFVIKTHRAHHRDEIAPRYGFKKVSDLPNRFTAVFDVKPQTSYDQLIEKLDRDRDIEYAVPLLSEPQYRPR